MLTWGTGDKSLSVLELKEGETTSYFQNTCPANVSVSQVQQSWIRVSPRTHRVLGFTRKEKETWEREHGEMLLADNTHFVSITNPKTLLRFSDQNQ